MFFHAHEAKAKEILSGQNVYAGEVIDLLMQIHPKKSIWLYFSISPPDVPVPYPLILLNNPAQLFSNFLNNRILSIWNINDNLFDPRFIS